MSKIRSVLFLMILIPALANAAIVQYDDRAAWDGASGGAELTEDFESFGADTPFRPEGTTVPTALGTMGEAGIDTAFRNTVDVAPFKFTDNNGTQNASCFVNAPEARNAEPVLDGAEEETAPGVIDGIIGTGIRLDFDAPVGAFGVDVSGALGAETLVIDVLDAGDAVLGSLAITSNDIDQFLGFVADGGEEVAAVEFRAGILIAGGTGEGFTIDNLVSVGAGPPPPGLIDIPTLSTYGIAIMVLMLTGAAIFFVRRRA